MIQKPKMPSVYAYDNPYDYYDAMAKYDEDCEYYYERDYEVTDDDDVGEYNESEEAL